MIRIKRLPDLIEGLSERTGQAVGWLALVMVLVMFTVVVLRYGFSIGSIALQESVRYLHATVFLVGAAFALKHEAHVRVDIFYRQMSPHGQALVDTLGGLMLLLPTCLFILFVSLPYVSESWRLLEGSREAGGLPAVFLLKTLIPVAMGLLALQGLVQAVRSIRRLRLARPSPHERDPGSL